MSTKLDTHDYIMVEKPYNILRDVMLNDDGTIEAKVTNEYLHKEEGGPIGGGEFGRHIAILGSVALALDLNHKKNHYYLAVLADLRRENEKVYRQDELRLKAKTLSHKKRKGKIHGELFNKENEVIYSAEIEYMVLSKAVFSKFYGRHRKDAPVNNEISPYINRRNLTNVVINSNMASGDYGIVFENECEGHFRHYPALPVALIGGLFGDLGFHLFKHEISGYDKLISPRTVIKARGLVFSGEHIYFVGKICKRISKNHIVIFAEAKVGEEVVADVEFELKGIKADECNP